jgi:hypothetical protein
MSYWITTHWPRKRDESTNQPQNGIWVKDENRTVIDRVAPEDLVFIYETRSGPDILRNNADGSKRRISRHPGAEGIAVLSEVTERAYEPENSSPEEYADGTKLWWRYYAPTERKLGWLYITGRIEFSFRIRTKIRASWIRGAEFRPERNFRASIRAAAVPFSPFVRER